MAEFQSLGLHDEINVRAALPASKTMPYLARRRDDERRRFLGVEWTGCFPIHPGLLEADVCLDKLDDIEPGFDVFERRGHSGCLNCFAFPGTWQSACRNASAGRADAVRAVWAGNPRDQAVAGVPPTALVTNECTTSINSLRFSESSSTLQLARPATHHAVPVARREFRGTWLCIAQ